jgi:hypothetical protein
MYVFRTGSITIETESLDEAVALARRLGVNAESTSSAPSTKSSNGKPFVPAITTKSSVDIKPFVAALTDGARRMIHFIVERGGSATTMEIARHLEMDDARGVGALLRNVAGVGRKLDIEEPVRVVRKSGTKGATIELSRSFAI